MPGQLLAAIFEHPTADDAQDQLEALITGATWPSVRADLLAVLADPRGSLDQWQLAAAAIWGACLDQRELPIARTIALVYARLPADEHAAESNLAWSIASKLRDLSYLSAADPLADSEVQRELAGIVPPVDPHAAR